MIKKNFFCLCSGIVIASTAHGQIEKVKSLNEYQLITSFSDEFNGTTLNTARWEDYDRASGRTNGEYVYANPTCNQVGAGSNGANVLKLIAKKEFINATDWYGVPHDHFYQAGAAVSKTFFYHGYYEIRAKMPNVRNTNGMAFWFWDRDTNGVYSEVDVFETQPIFKYNYPTATHHSNNANETYQYSLQNCTQIPKDITDDWHTYGVEWTPQAITFYVDGVIVDKNTIIQSSSSTDNTSITPIAIKRMRLVLANAANFGIEASTSGDVMEIDYFRYYKRKPLLYFVSYDTNTGHYIYAANTNTPGDLVTWSYNSAYLTDVSTYNTNGIQYLKFKRVSPTGNIALTATATQTLQLQDAITQNVTASSTIYVGNNTPRFFVDEPFFSGTGHKITAYSVTLNPNGLWSLGIKNVSGTVDWIPFPPITGASTNFSGLLSGKTYVLKHQEPAVGSHLVMSETTMEIPISYNSEFFVDKIQTDVPTSNVVKMTVHQVSTNPDSEWHLWLINPDLSVNMTVDQPQWGQTATFNNLIPGSTYQVTHGNYGPNQAWVASSKRIRVDLPSNFEFYNPVLYGCMGPRPRICSSNGVYKLQVFSRDYSPDAPLVNAHPSEFRIYELDQYGNHSETAPLAAPVLYGHSGLLTVQLNKSYLIKHGVYSPNGYWTETRKTMHTFPSYGCGMYIDANSGEEIEEVSDEVSNELVMSFQENEDSGLEVFPNPTSGELYIKQLNKTYQKASILDPLGRIVLNSFTLERESVDISKLPVGTYILQLESAEKGMKQIKIVKQ